MIDLPWLDTHRLEWLDLLLHDKVPHALLISGGKGLGKAHLAENIAQMALCENLTAQGVCHKCSACHLYQAGNHTDLSIISAEKTVIKVEQIRQLSRNVTLTNTRNQYKVILIKDAELMNNAAANALLKTLEEPPKKVIIILTCSEIGRVLATIKSRCLKLNLSTPKHQFVADWLLNTKQFSKQDIDLSLLMSSGAPLVALDILKQESLPVIIEMMSDLKQLSLNNKSVLDVSKQWINQELCLYLNYIAAYFLVLIKDYNHLNPIQIDGLHNLNLYSEINMTNNLLGFINEVHVFNKRYATALKSELLLEELLINWKKSFLMEN